jgi:hypothetical protein
MLQIFPLNAVVLLRVGREWSRLVYIFCWVFFFNNILLLRSSVAWDGSSGRLNTVQFQEIPRIQHVYRCFPVQIAMVRVWVGRLGQGWKKNISKIHWIFRSWISIHKLYWYSITDILLSIPNLRYELALHTTVLLQKEILTIDRVILFISFSPCSTV